MEQARRAQEENQAQACNVKSCKRNLVVGKKRSGEASDFSKTKFPLSFHK